MIDRYHLRYFLSVVDTGNFTRAASACNVSQPTLSIGIAKLERQLGKAVFSRSNKRVELTEAGALLAVHARSIEAGFARAEREVAGTPINRKRRLGVLTTTPRAWIEEILRRHRTSGSGDRIEVVEGRERELHERLTRGRLDLALTIVRDDQRYARKHLLSEGYGLALSIDHPLAGRDIIHAEELVSEPMIVRRHCEALAETSRFFTARGVRPFFSARTVSDDRALSYVRAGLGVTMMPDGFRDAQIARPRLEGFDLTRDLGLIYAPHTEIDGRALDALTELIAAAIEGFQSPRDLDPGGGAVRAR